MMVFKNTLGVGRPIIKITERNQLNGDSINNTKNRIGWNYQNLTTEDDFNTCYDTTYVSIDGENTYWVRWNQN